VVQLDVGNGWGDKQREMPDTHHVLGVVRGIEPNRHLHPLVVWHCSWRGCHGRNFSSQGLDDAPGHNVPGTPEHDVKCLAMLVVTRVRVGVATDRL
jgi:hypothetical protein